MNNQTKQTNYILAGILSFLIVTLLGVFSLGYLGTSLSTITSTVVDNTALKKPTKEQEIIEQIEKAFIHDIPEEVEYREYKLKGIVNSLQDPYSSYISQDEYNDLISSISNRYKGIGIYLESLEGSFLVSGVIENSPAEKSGVKQGDLILKVDDTATTGKNLQEVVQIIKGEENTTVTLQIARAGGQTIELDVTREEIQIDLVELEFKDNIAIIQISSFGEGLDQEMRRVSKEIVENSQIETIIIDVRSNTGGLLSEAIDAISYFVREDTLLLQEQSKIGRFTDSELLTLQKQKNAKIEDDLVTAFDLSTAKDYYLGDYPITVLVDNFSASASEILAASLKEQQGATIVGRTTFGKGLVQELIPISDGSFLKLTVAEWLTPQGEIINEKGVEPDVKVSIDEDILEKAIQEINNNNQK